jgi:hypothetical protein
MFLSPSNQRDNFSEVEVEVESEVESDTENTGTVDNFQDSTETGETEPNLTPQVPVSDFSEFTGITCDIKTGKQFQAPIPVPYDVHILAHLYEGLSGIPVSIEEHRRTCETFLKYNGPRLTTSEIAACMHWAYRKSDYWGNNLEPHIEDFLPCLRFTSNMRISTREFRLERNLTKYGTLKLVWINCSPLKIFRLKWSLKEKRLDQLISPLKLSFPVSIHRGFLQ